MGASVSRIDARAKGGQRTRPVIATESERLLIEGMASGYQISGVSNSGASLVAEFKCSVIDAMAVNGVSTPAFH